MIVLSILLALGADAWWQGREHRASEAAALAGLAQDFRGHREVIRVRTAQFEERLRASEQLLASIGPEADEPSDDTLRGLAVIGGANKVRFQGGTLETLIGTSGLALLQDEGLRVDLTRWMQGIEDFEVLNDFYYGEASQLLAYLRTRVALQDLDRLAEGTDEPESGFTPDLGSSLRDVEFSNLISQQHFATELMLDYLGRLSGIADDVLARLDGV